MCLHEHPTELRADLQRYYGLNLSDMGRTFDAFHAGACAVSLPLGSSTMARVNPACAWTYANYQLHAILCAIAGKQLPYPWDEGSADGNAETETIQLAGFATTEEFDAWLNQEWTDDYGKQFSL